jgi:hypothetical protein
LTIWDDRENRPFGWFQPEEGKLYTDTVSKYPGGLVVECGTYLGRSLSHILPTVKEMSIELYAVDIWRKCFFDFEPASLLESFQSNLQRMNSLGVVTVLQMSSLEAALLFRNNSVDVMMLDTTHTQSDTRAEIDFWWSKITDEGCILFHDYCDGWGVKQAVDDYFGKADQVAGALGLVTKTITV